MHPFKIVYKRDQTPCRILPPLTILLFFLPPISHRGLPHFVSWVLWYSSHNSQGLGFPGGPFGKESACNAGDFSLIPGSGRSPGEGIDYLLQYSWTSLVGQMQCRRPGFDPWVGKMTWRRKQLSSPVFWPGEFHWQRSLAGYSPWVTKSRTQLSD